MEKGLIIGGGLLAAFLLYKSGKLGGTATAAATAPATAELTTKVTVSNGQAVVETNRNPTIAEQAAVVETVITENPGIQTVTLPTGWAGVPSSVDAPSVVAAAAMNNTTVSNFVVQSTAPVSPANTDWNAVAEARLATAAELIAAGKPLAAQRYLDHAYDQNII